MLISRNLTLVYGVNGVGKTTSTELWKSQEIAPDGTSNAIRISGSTILMYQLFEELDLAMIDQLNSGQKRAYYDKLEAMDPDIKKEAYVKGIVAISQSHPDRHIIVDTHLMQPIRTPNEDKPCSFNVRYEDMWDERFLPYLMSVVFIDANPEIIFQRKNLDRRERDPITIEEIESDILINKQRLCDLNDQIFKPNGIPLSIYSNDSPISEQHAETTYPTFIREQIHSGIPIY
jgi:adenylate kinase